MLSYTRTYTDQEFTNYILKYKNEYNDLTTENYLQVREDLSICFEEIIDICVESLYQKKRFIDLEISKKDMDEIKQSCKALCFTRLHKFGPPQMELIQKRPFSIFCIISTTFIQQELCCLLRINLEQKIKEYRSITDSWKPQKF